MVAASLTPKEGTSIVLRLADRKVLQIENPTLASQWVLAPASTIKPFSILALLEAGKLQPTELFPCSRHLRIGSHALDCVHPPVPLPMNASRAIAYSCNSAVAHFAERFVVDELPTALTRFGLTSVTALLSSPEATGSLKRNTVGDSCKLQSLGEEGIAITPLELVLAYARLANRITAPRYAPILEGLEGAVEFGTAQAAQVSGMRVAGKTGSIAGAAWFAGFAPSRAPRVAVVVLVQGHSGGADAAPLAAELLEKNLA